MKKIYLLAAAAALFAACSSDKVSLDTPQQPTQLEESAVGFDVYTQKATTRAGETGTLTTADLKTGGFADDGFGVFGYYTDNNDYEQRATPNFFYNQQVKWNNGTPKAWEYTPIKYWPNEYGNKAVSDESDKVTYFAYAPWVPVIASSGKIKGADLDKSLEQWGITGMTKNTTQGDPMLKYIASFDAQKSVDLCWGVADNNDGVWPTVQPDASVNIPNGKPWLNVQRPANVNQKVKFTFKHATAQMRVNIDAIIDEVRPADPPADPTQLDKKTRIWVRSVTFKGFALKGTLNLNNDDNAYKPYWLDYNGQNELVAEDVTVYDGRKDGKEGVAGAVATNEKTLGLNPRLIQDGVYSDASYKTVNDNENKVYTKDQTLTVVGPKVDGSAPTGDDRANYNRPGVTHEQVNLFAQDVDNMVNKTSNSATDKNAIFHVIPVDENFEVEIVYDVETVSENLAQSLSDGITKGTSIENRIRKTVTFSDDASGKKLQAGHSYALNLHLGMNSVKVDATVGDWIEEAAQDVDLPLNVPSYAVGAASSYGVTLPYVQPDNKFTFAITGLDGGESVTHGALPFSWTVPDPINAWSNGIALVSMTTKVNPSTQNRTESVTFTGAQSTKEATITFTQSAHPLFLTGEASANSNEITLTRHNNADPTSEVTDWSGSDDWWVNATGGSDGSKYIKVWRNGVLLSQITSGSPDVSEFLFPGTKTNNTAIITIKDNLVAGDVIMVTLKTGDAPEETISITVPTP